MESRIPLPTDNIYKFYALFGLVLIVSSMLAIVYVHKTTNELAFQTAIEYEELNTKENLSPGEAKRKEIIEKRISIEVKDRDIFTQLLSYAIGAGIVLSVFGFWRWATVIQPRQDKLLDLQIQKAEQDIKKPPREPFRRPK